MDAESCTDHCMDQSFEPSEVTPELTTDVFNRLSMQDGLFAIDEATAVLSVFAALVVAMWYSKIPFQKFEKWLPLFGVFSPIESKLHDDKSEMVREVAEAELRQVKKAWGEAYSYWLNLSLSLEHAKKDYPESELNCDHLRDEFRLRVKRWNMVCKTPEMRLDISRYFGVDPKLV